ncbi:hypothetical protein ABZX98_12325 [Streptomyces sp. NPDC002992]|uniref:DUF7919 family protein n=1 Tax=Streptomyces sp. NPDC002992 TaxID=3154273 RepID=UPI0033AD552C
MFYADLSQYDYQDEDAFTDRESGFYALWYRPAYIRLNIGWLEAGKPYSTGTVPAVFMKKLKAVQEIQWMNVCLGVHECDLCPEEGLRKGTGSGSRACPASPMPRFDRVWDAPFGRQHATPPAASAAPC